MKVGLLLFMLLVVILYPLGGIWALNTLFPSLAIPYNFSTWAAMVLLSMLVNSGSVKRG